MRAVSIVDFFKIFLPVRLPGTCAWDYGIMCHRHSSIFNPSRSLPSCLWCTRQAVAMTTHLCRCPTSLLNHPPPSPTLSFILPLRPPLLPLLHDATSTVATPDCKWSILKAHSLLAFHFLCVSLNRPPVYHPAPPSSPQFKMAIARIDYSESDSAKVQRVVPGLSLSLSPFRSTLSIRP